MKYSTTKTALRIFSVTVIFILSILGANFALAQTSEVTMGVDNTSLLMGQTLSVSYSAPENAHNRYDRIEIFNTDDGKKIAYTYVGTEISGVKDFKLDKPGTYEARYYLYGAKTTVVSSPEVTVSVPPASLYGLTASSENLQINETLTFNYNAPDFAHNRYDRIDIYNTDDGRRVSYKYVGTPNSGSVEFTLDKPGTYEARYVLYTTKDVILTVAPINVSLPPASAYSLSIPQNSYEIGDTIQVSFSAPTLAHNRYDRIDIYNTDDGRRVTYKNLGTTNTGTVEFVLNNPGNYEARYVLYINKEVILTEGPISVSLPPVSDFTLTPNNTSLLMGQTLSVSYSAPENAHNRYDRIEIFNTDDGKKIAYTYVGTEISGVKDFKLDKPGTYEARYYLYGAKTTVVSSPEVTVSVPPASLYGLTASSENLQINETLTFNYNAPDFAHNRYDRIDIYNTDDGRRVSYKYVGTPNSGSVEFTLDKPGTYEARYVLYTTKDVILTVAPINVSLPPASAYSLSIPQNSYEIGDTIQVSFSAPTLAHNRYDRIDIYNTDDGRRVTYKNLGTTNTGTVEFVLNNPGNYEARYVLYINKEVILTEGPISVSLPPVSDFTLELSGTDLTIGDTLSVTFDVPDKIESPYDRVELYDTDANRRIAYAIFSRESDGIYDVRITEPGNYEVRLVPYILGSAILTSAPITVDFPPFSAYTVSTTKSLYTLGEAVTVTYSAPTTAHNPKDEILFVDQSTDKILSKAALGPNSSGTVTFTGADLGSFDVRYRLDAGDEPVVAGSEPFIVSLNELADVTNYPNNSGPIIALGASVTWGRDADPGQDYVSLLSSRTGENIINAGVSGDTAADALLRLDEDVLSKNPKLTLVLLGGNDFLDGIDDDVIFTNLEEVVNQIHQNGSVVILLGARDFFYTNYDGRFRQVALNTGAFYAPDILDDIVGNPFITTDLIHPTNEGHVLIADRIEPYLNQVLGI